MDDKKTNSISRWFLFFLLSSHLCSQVSFALSRGKSCLSQEKVNSVSDSPIQTSKVILEFDTNQPRTKCELGRTSKARIINIQPKREELYEVLNRESFFSGSPKSKSAEGSQIAPSIAFSQFPARYRAIAQLQYEYYLSELQSRYPSFKHYLFSLFSESSFSFEHGHLEDFRIDRESALEAIAVLEAVEQKVVAGPIQRNESTGWIVDRDGKTWEVITPIYTEPVTIQTLTSLEGDFLFDSVFFRVQKFIGLQAKLSLGSSHYGVLINLAALPKKLRDLYVLGLNLRLKPFERRAISYLFSPV